MQSFLGDGGKGGNALKKVAQREGVDNSLFRDRYNSQASGSSSQQSAFSQGSRAQNQAPPSGQLTSHPPQPFNLSHLSAALADPTISGSSSIRHSPAPLPRHFEQSWGNSKVQNRNSPTPFINEFNPVSNTAWAESFNPKGKSRAVEMSQQPMNQGPGYEGGFGYQTHQPMVPFQPTFTPMYQNYGSQSFAPQPVQQMSHGPDQLDLDKNMEEAFEKAMNDWKAMSETHQSSQDHVESQSTQAEEGRIDDGVEDRGETKGELDKIWESLKPEAERLNKLAEWEKDFSQFTNDEDDLFESLNESLNRSDIGQTPLEDQMRIDESVLNRSTDQVESEPDMSFLNIDKQRSYEYTLPNRFDVMQPQDAWTEANRLLNEGGSLTDATLLLETYIRRGIDTGMHGSREELEAWTLLGKTHAMNEKEEKALSAFEEGRRSIKGDSAGQGMGDMLTNLAISYVNESADFEALQVLHQFLALAHPEHAGPAPTREFIESRSNPWACHQDITDKYLALARDQYNSKQEVDPDVQVGLGTLYYMMGEYNEARDCWVAALGERPDDYLLWNRLGATLANGGNPEEAVDAYRRALEIKPLFTRATFNLGVACLIIGVHREAAEHILGALSLHSKDAEKEQRDSTPMWLTLRRALIALDMLELSGKARPGADLQTFRDAGFDF